MLYYEIIAACSKIGTEHINMFCVQIVQIVGDFAKLLKVTICFVISVRLPGCLSVCPSAQNNSAPIGRIFLKFDVWVFF